MKNLIIVLLFVTIWVHQWVPEDCNGAGPFLTKQEDGSYMRGYGGWVTSMACSSTKHSHREVWTDYPDKGGKYLYSVETMDQLLENMEHRSKQQMQESIESMSVK